MDDYRPETPRPVNPRRRRRSRAQIFKESYLPVIIAGAAIVLILIFIIGSISRAVEKSRLEKEEAIAASIAAQEEAQRLSQEAATLIQKADAQAAGYDYDAAIRTLDSFSGDAAQFGELRAKREAYVLAQSQLSAWSDPNAIVNLSFQMLLADPERAWKDASLSRAYNRNFITTVEFSNILQQLYQNNYILVSLEDFIEATPSGYQYKTLYLPSGKKPLVLTQMDVNYHTYMLDSNKDKLPDKDGDGFATKLMLDANGQLTCEYMDSSSNVTTGAYDLIPILESFIREHPDFSYRGARAVISVSGYDGVFGYRTNAEAEQYFGTASYEQSIANAKAVAQALREQGYLLACNSFKNETYNSSNAEQIAAELAAWTSQVVPILGEVNIFAFPRNSDIQEPGAYSGDRYQALQNLGFTYYLGYCQDAAPWTVFGDGYVRQGQLVVSGANIVEHPEWFNGLFSTDVLDSRRGEMPK